MKTRVWMIPQGLQPATCWLIALALLTFNPVPVQAQPLVNQHETLTPVAGRHPRLWLLKTPYDDRDRVPVGTQDGRAVPQAVQPQSEDIFLAFMEMAVPAVRKIARASF